MLVTRKDSIWMAALHHVLLSNGHEHQLYMTFHDSDPLELTRIYYGIWLLDIHPRPVIGENVATWTYGVYRDHRHLSEFMKRKLRCAYMRLTV